LSVRPTKPAAFVGAALIQNFGRAIRAGFEWAACDELEKPGRRRRAPSQVFVAFEEIVAVGQYS